MRSKHFICRLSSAILLAVAGSVQGLTLLSGDLEAFLKSIDYGDAGDNTWVAPTAEMADQFADVFDRFLSQDFDEAHRRGSSLGYEVIEYTDTAIGRSGVHYILRETQQPPTAGFIGGGTYVLFPDGLELVLEAPHPVFDRYSAEQAIETYLATSSWLLALSGTRRDNSTALTPCTGTYAASDAGHNTQHLFFVAHVGAFAMAPNSIFIQFHGFGSSSLRTLQSECATTNPLLVNLSEGVRYPSQSGDASFMQILRSKIEADGIITPCVYGVDTNSLGGTWNVSGRYSNGSLDACIDNASVSSQRFIHLEQSFGVRAQYRADMAEYILQAATAYLPQ